MCAAMNKTFVFVVCGAKEHLDTLNFSLKALRRFSNLPILVITDLSRNETEINHPKKQVIDIRTDAAYNHHQASIYLKTGLHKFLPMEGNRYCYLDTDVVALNAEVDAVFNHYTTPITFATDHCRMNGFSPHAINCNCTVLPQKLQSLLDKYQQQYSHLIKNQAQIDALTREWLQFERKYPLEQAKNLWFNGLLKNKPDLLLKREQLLKLTNPKTPILRLVFNYLFRVLPNFRRSIGVKRWKDLKGNILLDEGPAYHEFMRSKGFSYERSTGKWLDNSGNVAAEIPKNFDAFIAERGFYYDNKEEAWYTNDRVLFLPNITKLIERNSSYWYDQTSDTWYDGDNNRVFKHECNHLKEAIKKDFDVDVKQADWQHWNGGVFLFDTESIPFLDTWHRLTLEAFNLPYWKTRDQGTLITTVWKMGLENQPTIPFQFNFIADYHHPTMMYENNLTFRIKVGEPTIAPSLIHIYHHWGDTSWKVWSDVEKHITST